MSNEQKHTPGPWTVRALDVLIIEAADGLQICDTASPDKSAAEDMANARLIATTPDLLSLAKEALPQLRWANLHGSRCPELIAEFEQVIAKADGH